jgi:hypothetical protein
LADRVERSLIHNHGVGGRVRYRVTHTSPVAASARRVYGILADYHNGHPRILPAQFRNFVVEAGGRGAGTLTRFDVRVFGRTQSFRHEVLEPDPGHILVERDRDLDSFTTFTVEPIGAHARVTIDSELTSRPGLAGRIERFLSTRVLTRMYRQELENLNAVAQGVELAK